METRRRPQGLKENDQRPAGSEGVPAASARTCFLSLVVVILILTGLPLAGG